VWQKKMTLDSLFGGFVEWTIVRREGYNEHMMNQKKGAVVPIILGVLSVMLIFAINFSKRFSSQTAIVTVTDQTQIARFFMESFAGDVRNTIVRVINNREDSKFSELYTSIREKPEKATIPSSFYQASSHLKGLEGKLSPLAVSNKKVELEIVSATSLTYPAALKISPQIMERERQGILRITCSANVGPTKRYTVNWFMPFKVVMCLNPLLKDFVMYFDQVSLEQALPYGTVDKLNILETEKSEHPKQKPWIVFPSSATNPYANGMIFLGKDDSDIFLNLAGEDKCLPIALKSAPSMSAAVANKSIDTDGQQPNRMCDLWQVNMGLFSDPNTVTGGGASPNDIFTEDPTRELGNSVYGQWNPLRDKNTNEPKDMRKGYIGTKTGNGAALLFVMGFSKEVSNYEKIPHFLKSDPSFDKLKNDLASSSALKLRGINLEGITGPPYLSNVEENSDLKYEGYPNLIFGNVFNRFMILSFVVPNQTDIAAGDNTLPYNTSKDHAPDPLRSLDGEEFIFEPKPPMNYHSVMSRIVSGGGESAGSNRPGYYSVNKENAPLGGAKVGLNRSLSAANYKSKDGTTIKMTPSGGTPFARAGKFEYFAGQWMPSLPETFITEFPANIPAHSTLLYRVFKVFQNQADFKAYAFRKTDKGPMFNLDGIVLVKGPVDLSGEDNPLKRSLSDFSDDQIRGGMLISTDKITLSNISRGFDVKDTKKLSEAVGKMPQDKLLSFVSLKPSIKMGAAPGAANPSDCFELNGNNFIGIHLIALSPESLSRPADMLKITPKDPALPVTICGGIALSTPNMEKRVLETKFPVSFQFMPSMAEVGLTYAHVSSKPRGYEFYIDSTAVR
jgi:hypothetical protein